MMEMTTDALELYCRNLSKAKNDLTEYDRALLMDVSTRLCELQSRTAEDDKAREEGLLVRLPCKVGDTVYRRYMDCQKPYKPTHCTDHEGSCEHCGHRTPIALPRAFDYSMIPLFGKTVFLTRQEAALGGGEGD